VLRVTSRLIALLQRLEPDATEAVADPVETPGSFAPVEAGVPSVPQEPVPTSAWQKIVVRYSEGQILKGYTHDFSQSRPHFSLWPSPTAAPHERVIVPVARLKGVFFVRDFAGNPGYVERRDASQLRHGRPMALRPQHGRRIEVTLLDDEVVVGRTLSYRTDGHGFFVIPADPLGNNIRIFIVSSSVRQVRFP
jgi:hypothetical protein